MTWSLANVQLTNRPLIFSIGTTSQPAVCCCPCPCCLAEHGSLSCVPPRYSEVHNEREGRRPQSTTTGTGEEINSWNGCVVEGLLIDVEVISKGNTGKDISGGEITLHPQDREGSPRKLLYIPGVLWWLSLDHPLHLMIVLVAGDLKVPK